MNQSPTSYDLVIAGAGAAGLSLLMRLMQNGYLQHRQVLLIDREDKNLNDRTWCFWEQGPGFFERLVYRSWSSVGFYSNDYSSVIDMAPYRYKMIRGIDFYNYCKQEIQNCPQVHWVKGIVNELNADEQGVRLKLNGQDHFYKGAKAFSSIPRVITDQPNALHLLQHFKGWVIRTDAPRFHTGEATLMDFRVDQQHGTAFVYVLPFSAHEALVEYTLFTPSLLQSSQYEEGLRHYIQHTLEIAQYTIREEEFGIIPMTNTRFAQQVNGVFQLGTAGGQTKASSGYTFRFIQKQSEQLAAALLENKKIEGIGTSPARFRFYDEVLLYVLQHELYPGHKIFSRLFQKNPPSRVFRFLDNESSITSELKLISTLPVRPFLKAAMKKRSPY